MLRRLLLLAVILAPRMALADQGRVIVYQHLLNAAAAGSNHTSANVDMGLSIMGSVQCSWASLTGTVNATVQVNVSVDDVHFDNKSSGLITLSGASGHAYLPFVQTPERYYQVVYTAGTVTGGTVDCWLDGK